MKAEHGRYVICLPVKHCFCIKLIDINELHDHCKYLHDIHLILVKRQARLLKPRKEPLDLAAHLVTIVAFDRIQKQPLIVFFQLEPGCRILRLHILYVRCKPSFFPEQRAVFQRVFRLFEGIFKLLPPCIDTADPGSDI